MDESKKEHFPSHSDEVRALSSFKKLVVWLPSSFSRVFKSSLGPGVITGASDDDPSGIATYSQAGAQFGFGMLWLALYQFPMMNIVQEMCARIGLVTGSGLASVIKKK